MSSQVSTSILNISYRNFRKTDYPAIIELWSKTGIGVTLSDEQKELERLAFQENNKFIILLIDDTIVGTAICAFDGRRGYIHHVAIHPKHQNQGLGRKIIEQSIAHYDSLNAVKVHLFIEKDNLEVISFYQKLGWRIRDDLIMMTKTLRS